MKNLHWLASILGSVFFTLLFYKNPLGLNFLVFDIMVVGYLAFTRSFKKLNLFTVTALAGVAISGISFVFAFSTFAFVVNVLMLMILVGMVIFPSTKSYINAVGFFTANIFASQQNFVKGYISIKTAFSIKKLLKRISIFVIPLLIIFLFVLIYRNSNPVFDNLMHAINKTIGNFVSSMFTYVNWQLIFTFIFGIFVVNLFVNRNINKNLEVIESKASMILIRKKSINTISHKMNALALEAKSAIFLVAVLNIILLVVNYIDISWVWFNFEWEGQYLKQFVHQGTYLLILSILIAMAVILYLFRGNQNFYKRNSNLKWLSYLWLAQNIVLAISVIIRNYYYIQYFALAYKRIAVGVFLIISIFALVTIMLKIARVRSFHFLFSANSFATVLILILCSTINWDVFIAKYNFAHSNHSFLHLNFMVGLSDKALPYLDKSQEDMGKIKISQEKNFSFKTRYLNPEDYRNIIEKRKVRFKAKWESKGFLSWNYPEYKAYRKLQAKE